MKRRLLTLDDLYDYFAKKQTNYKFSASENHNCNIVVQVDGTMLFKKTEKDTEGLTPVTLESCHVGKNLNGSKISEKSMKSALPSFSNRPILGYIHEVNGEPQFYTHNMHLDENDELVYDEYPVGVIPESCNARLKYDEEKDKTYVVVDGYLFEEYSKQTEIVQREGTCPVSVELSIRELSYDADEKVLNLDDFYFSGVTILGVDEDGNTVNPGMEGSNITLAEFSNEGQSDLSLDAFNAEHNSVFSNARCVELLEELNKTLASFKNIKTQGKEECTVEFEENKDVNSTEEETVVTEAETVTEETTEDSPEVEQEFADENAEQTEENRETEEDETDTDGEDGDTAEFQDDDPTEEQTEDTTEEVVIDDDTLPGKKVEYAVNVDGNTRNFSVTLNDQLYALSVLVNDTYGEQDMDWYSVDADADKKIVYMFGWSKAYRQSYKVKNDVFSLVGDRVEITPVWMTADEKKAFEKMMSDYSSISEKLEKYEAEPEKIEILNSKDYLNIADTEAFQELKKQENHFDLSVDELRAKADQMLLEFAKGNHVEFAESKKNVGIKQFGAKKPAKSGRYGNLFKKQN